ncbi:L-fuculokinase [Flammeovirga yaeyamensis]|uniref:L-fuculokinase n=1 Tax=Flammeovirga yaeyamensis TaxID=367791 RepID=A0AAX1ND92_9BACT|nr:L-fuculokinase [Flammeovirga yaeyamensis]MBB3699534.1 L-fuculokinase [Flammeovirga yaeyamensis]NMF35210.1 L-fuculokinase [Flammeovirga yaeyamensis]QWG04072.1 L-fuculokinase [Flammeovirga yaeyamensis]
MEKDLALVLDCGATNIRTIVLNKQGEVVAKFAINSTSRPDPLNEEYTIWDIDEMMDKLSFCSKKVVESIDPNRIASIGISTFGVDGAFVNETGELLSPVISWKCQRTIPILENIDKYFSSEELLIKTGVGAFSFNTINKLIWYKENQKETIDQAKHWLFISSLIGYKLTNEFYTDHTMAGTSQLCNLQTQDFDVEILEKLELDRSLFPTMKYAGEEVGKLNGKAAAMLGLPVNIPVKSIGHDTQFALFGAGVDLKNAVLSSGTWEILMVQASEVNLKADLAQHGITVEFDPAKGKYNIGLQWMASANIEWVKNTFFKDIPLDEVYEVMIKEALKSEVEEDFYVPKLQPNQKIHLTNLDLLNNRGDIFNSCMRSLSQQLKKAIDILEEVSNFKIDQITVVGGGARNAHWNQHKANATDLKVKTIQEKETTVLGASFFLFDESSEEIRSKYAYNFTEFIPSNELEVV